MQRPYMQMGKYVVQALPQLPQLLAFDGMQTWLQQRFPKPHSVSFGPAVLHPQTPLMQALSVALAAQFRQVGPQCAASVAVQGVHCPPLHHLPSLQEAVQVPPHPSLAPPHLSWQFGVQQPLW